MRNIKLIYSYDGSMFYGFQRQPDKRTVQGEIEKLLNILLKEEINLISSGRTDRGVHALMQVSNFKTNSNIPTSRLLYALSRGLPSDIVIKDVIEEEINFNSRFDAKKREYEYIITSLKNPFRARYESFYKEKIDILKLKEIMKEYIGVHNFNNFRMSDCGSKNPMREIYELDIIRLDEYRIKIRILGNAFLKSQIRIMVQTALDIYFGKANKDLIKNMFINNNKMFKKRVASPEGLYLSKIYY